MELRNIIRRILEEKIPVIGEQLGAQNTFPYGHGTASEPQMLDPLTDYVMDWESLSTNNSVFDFPKDEFEIGMKMERNKDPKSQILDIAKKVLDTLKGDPHFYSSMQSRRT